MWSGEADVLVSKAKAADQVDVSALSGYFCKTSSASRVGAESLLHLLSRTVLLAVVGLVVSCWGLKQ
jgi:hypothetical protein